MFKLSSFKFGIWHLVLVFVGLGLAYTFTVPVFESPDEPWHFNYVRYVVEQRALPSLLNNDSGAYQEVGQPPLYYLVTGLIVAPIGTGDLHGLMWHNPGFGYHAPGTVNDNKNLLIHTAQEAFPWRGAVLALHVARLVSLVFGALTVLATWGLAREVFPDSPSLALAAAALVALTPQFVFMSSVTSNDSSAAALSTAALWAIARMWRLGGTLRRAALTGLLVGLASLTKTSTILLSLVAVAAILGRAGGSRRSNVAVLAIVALAIGGWWYVRNGLLYGDPLALRVHLDTPWARPATIPLIEVFPSLPLIYRSFWGAFGWGNVEMSPLVYGAIALVLVASAIGWVAPQPKTQSAKSMILLICFVWCGAVSAALLRWNQQVEAPHGRLLFPMIGALAVLLVAGLARLPWPRLALSLVAGGFLLLSFVTPLAYIHPAYAQPEIFSLQQPGDQLAHVGARDLLYGDQARLIGFALDRQSVSPGDWLNVTLCWAAARPMARDYTLFVHLLGRENLVVGARNTWPGLGRFPTSLWPAQGRAFCDTVPVQVEMWAPAPELYAVEAGLYDAETDDRLEAADASGALVAPPIVGQVRIAPAQPLRVSPQHAARAEFGLATLFGFDAPAQAHPGDVVRLQLYWRVKTSSREDYTVFAHLVGDSGRLVAQADSEPRGGAYPTSAWVAGEIVPDDHVLRLPADLAPGIYSLSVGLYLAPNGPRLPLDSPSGDAFTLGTLQVQ